MILVVARPVAGETNADDLRQRFADSVRPFLQTYCLPCHGKEQPEAELDLSAYTSMSDVSDGHRTWEIVLQRLEAHEMPPEEAERQLTPEQRRAVIDWIRDMRAHEAGKSAGDPGPVPARRLSNAEYNYTIRDLTGVDIRPTQEFPVDPANEAGFDNSGESLAMTPALLTKYLAAARLVAEHLVLKPDGFAFAPHPTVTETDRDKYCVKRIVQFYERQPTDYADYFLAAWRFRHRGALGNPAARLADMAAEAGVSAKYLGTIWSVLSEPSEMVGPIAELRTMWSELPGPEKGESAAVRAGCQRMREFVVELRAKLQPQFSNLSVRGMHKGSQPLVLWKNRQYAAHRRSYDPDALHVAAGGSEDQTAEGADLDLLVPADEDRRAAYEASLTQFCSVFPDTFYVSERGRVFLERDADDVEREKGRLLSAGFHSMMGYFRDDAPLYELILDEPHQRELDALWQELDFITFAPMRQHAGFIWFERTDSRFMISSEFDFARAEDKDATSETKIKELAEVYLAKAHRNGADEVATQAIEDHFRSINASIRWVEQARLVAEPTHLEAIQAFAERAYRRPLSSGERDEVLGFYRSLRDRDGLDHEEAVRDTVVSILMSPYFCYRIAFAENNAATGRLSDYALASRLSYFLWSSMPDEELLAQAAAGRLNSSEAVVAQARRMLSDERVRGLAVEFAGNWLDFRRFEEHNSVDRERFPSFNDALRQAMFEEPIRFFVDLVREDRSVLDLLFADRTFVNPVLAEHYEMPQLGVASEEWLRVDGASQYGRGGVLPMSVFLTMNAPGLRTSPVKRGYWVVHRLLGERIPAPPPNVPELPTDETQLGELTLPEVLSRHREHKSCAACHERFDSIGLAFEGYGPAGERRLDDLGGRPVDTHATFPGGFSGTGLDGLRRYLHEYRQKEFLDSMCRKLLCYALGRSLILSDELLLENMGRKLTAEDHRFGSLVESIVASPQFLTTRIPKEEASWENP